MNITVFGASGGIGTHLVSLAAERGHQVRAVYRSTPQTPPPGQAEILISPDIFDPGFAATAISGADAVITAVGPNFATRHNPRTAMTSPPDLHQQLARTVIAAMTVRASRWCRSGGEVMAVRGLWRVAKFGPTAVTTTSAPVMAVAAKPGAKMSGLVRTSVWLGGGVCGVPR